MPDAMSAGPLGRAIGWRDELRDNVVGGTARRITEGCQLLLHRVAGPRRIAIRARSSSDRTLFVVGVALDQARIDGKAFAANQTGRDARLDNLFDLLPFAFIGRKGVGICVVPMVRPSV